MICSSLCHVPFMAVLLSWVWENSHSRRSSFRGLGHPLARDNPHTQHSSTCSRGHAKPRSSAAKTTPRCERVAFSHGGHSAMLQGCDCPPAQQAAAHFRHSVG